MQHRILTWMLIVVVTLISVGTAAAYGGTDADIRVIHAMPDMDGANFYLNDIYAGTLNFGQSAPYIIVPPGEVTLRMYALGNDPTGTLLYEGTFSAEVSQAMNVVLSGTRAAPTLGAYNVDRLPLALGQSRVNIVNTLADEATINITTAIEGGEQMLNTELAFGQSEAAELPVGRYLLNIGDFPQEVLDFNTGTVYSIILIGNSVGTDRAEMLVFSGGTELGGSAGFVRLVQTMPGAALMDVYVGDTLIIPYLEYMESTAYIALPTGSYSADFYAVGEKPGTGTPLLQNSFQVGEGMWTIGVLAGTDAPALTWINDNVSAVPAGQSRLTVYNASADNVEVAVEGATVVPALAGSTTSAGVLLPTEISEITISTGEGEPMSMGYVVSPNSAFNLRTLIIGADANILLSGCSLPPSA